MSNIIGNAQLGFNNLSDNKINISKLIKEISNNILENKNVIIKANENDILENNGFEVDFDAIRTILNNIKEQKSLYKTKLLNKQKQEVTEYDNLGVLETFFDGNSYILIEMALKSIISHNSMILISQRDYMKYTNAVIYNILTRTLNSQKIDENIIQLIYDFDILKYCTNNLIIKKAFVIGNTDLHRTIKRVSKLDTKYIEYNDCDIYIENIENIDKLKEFINSNSNVLFKIYINQSSKIKLDKAIYVEDVQEAIEKIRFDSCNYCTMLFSNRQQTKVEFSELCKAKYIFVNRFMNSNQAINIDINEFYCKKNIII